MKWLKQAIAQYSLQAMKINDRVFFALVLTIFSFLVFFSGRLSLQYALHERSPPIITIPEINQKVPIVEITGFRSGYLFGKVSVRDMRLKTPEQISVPNEQLEFSLNMSEFLPKEQQLVRSMVTGAPEDAKFVASKIGKYYYEIDSTSAKRLSLKNRRYFSTEEEAKKAGFQKKNR